MYTDSGEVVERLHAATASNTHATLQEIHHTSTPPLTASKQLRLWNETQQEFPPNTCVPSMIAQQATHTPNAVAVVANGQMLLYKELNQRANQLAHHLLSLGIQSGAYVGFCVERSLDLVIGLLGILKAGCAYVPLDPSYPPERLTYMLENAHTPVIITQQHLLSRFSIQNARCVCLDSDAALLSEQNTTDPTLSITGTDLAYAIYTSGSTGQPKGVEITHKSLLNLIYWHQQTFKVTAVDRATQLTSPAFDATGWELWPYLTCGASVYFVDDEARVEPTLLRDWLLRNEITITFLPTMLAERVLTLQWPASAPLRALLTGADTLRHYPPAGLPFTLFNNYGPTEATVVATSGPVHPNAHAEMPPSIGRPIANTQIYILDEQLRQVPIGEPGELHIGGSGLARGYLNRPDLTEERFIPDPFSTESGARLYKTGDLARFLPDGQIAFMGRTDQQIKIRGYRIEPGEIATALHQHPSIHTSFVTAREETPGDKRLIAYIVLKPDTRVTASALQEVLSQRLPDYMIPSAFVLLKTLPLTANGKVDRSALPASTLANTLRDVVPPSTPTEERLEHIVATLLGLEQVGVDENFFMLGGHSMLGTQVITRIAETFDIKLALRTLFDTPTIRQLAVEIEQLILAKIEAMSEDEARNLLGN